MKPARPSHSARQVSAALLVLGALSPTAVAQPAAPPQAALVSPSPHPASVRAEPADLAALRLKAEKGNAIAQYNLGLAYGEGRSVPRDVVEAFVWLSLAAEGGSTTRALEALIDSMTDAQLANGRQRLSAARAANPYPRAVAGESAAAVVPAPSAPSAAIDHPASDLATPGGGGPAGASVADASSVVRELEAARQTIARLEAELAALRRQYAAQLGAPSPGDTPDVAALRAQLREAQAVLETQSADLARARAEAETARIAAAKLQADLAIARETIEANGAANSVAGEALAALDRERAAHHETRRELDQTLARLGEVSTALPAARTTASSARDEGDGAAAENARLTAALAAESAAKAEAISARDQAQAAADTARQAAAVATARSEELARELSTTASSLAQARIATAGLEKERIQLQDATRGDAAELESVRRALAESEKKLAAAGAKTAAQADVEEKLATALRSYSMVAQERDELRARATRTEAVLRQAEEQAAQSRAALAQAEERADSSRKASVPRAESEELQRTLAQAQQQLAANAREIAALREQAQSAREWENRARQLEREKEVSVAPGPDAAAEEKLANARKAQADAEERLATALRSYSTLVQERDELKARLTAVESRPPVSAAPDPALLAELETMRARVDAAERMAFAAQGEIARLSQLRTSAPPAAAVPLERSSVAMEPTRPSSLPPAAALTPAAPVDAVLASGTSGARMHTIAIGDTLSGISRKYYGTPHRWIEIFSANRDVLRDERSLVVGRTLRIP